MIAPRIKRLYNTVMGKDELDKAEEKANAMLDVFFEQYDELHHLIHHRKSKAEQNKLKKDFPDIYYKDFEAQKQLIKLAKYVNSKAKKNGSKP